MNTMKKWLALLFLSAVYILGFLLGFSVFTYMTGIHVILRLLVVALSVATVIYVVGLVFKSASFVDPLWSVLTPVLMLYLMIYYNAFNLGTVLYFLVFCFWAVRLTLNFVQNYTGITYEDWRYSRLRVKTGKWFFLVNIVIDLIFVSVVFCASTPMFLYILEIQDFGLWQMVGLAVMALGAFLNSSADAQMHHFHKNRSLKSQIYDKKLWKNCRHPNYLGEIIMWIGVGVVFLSAMPERGYVVVAFLPVLILYICTSLAAEKYYLSYKPDYAIYRKNTYMLLPFPKRHHIPYQEDDTMKWVTMWGNAQSKTKPEPARYAKNLTLRYPVYIPFDGSQIRITLDNYCVDDKAFIQAVGIARGDSLSDQQRDMIYLTFDGERSFEIPAHGSVTSDPVPYPVQAEKFLIVNIYIKSCCDLTGGVDIVGPLSKGYFAYGNQMEAEALDKNTSKSTSWVYFLSNVDVLTDEKNECVICYGDSITSQDWPDYMQLHLKEMGVHNVAVVRKAVSGTRILRQYECITYQSYGLKGENRFNHEVSSVSGAKKVLIQHGINDIIHPVGEEVNIFRPMSDMPTVEDLIGGMQYYTENAKRMGLEVYYGNLLPIYNWRTYADFREEVKNSFNSWIAAQNGFVDFESEISNKEALPIRFAEGMDSGDHLHPSKKAYERMGNLAAEMLYGNK